MLSYFIKQVLVSSEAAMNSSVWHCVHGASLQKVQHWTQSVKIYTGSYSSWRLVVVGMLFPFKLSRRNIERKFWNMSRSSPMNRSLLCTQAYFYYFSLKFYKNVTKFVYEFSNWSERNACAQMLCVRSNVVLALADVVATKLGIILSFSLFLLLTFLPEGVWFWIFVCLSK